MKIFTIIFLFFLFCGQTFALEDLGIITREQWGANESYRYLEGKEWKEILQKRLNAKKIDLSESQLQAIKKASEKKQQMNKILLENFYDDIRIIKTIRTHGNMELAWNIQKTQNVKSIVVHHTIMADDDPYVAVRKIYKFHALTRQWGDIGYHYLIGKNGEIFEGRAGGDYVVGAHDKWNNRSTVGIALIGDYSEAGINSLQYKALEKLVESLVKKYEIDVTTKKNYHKECVGENCILPLDSFKMDFLVGHRDGGHTSCPGDVLYSQIQYIKRGIIVEVKARNINTDKLEAKLVRVSSDSIINIIGYLDKKNSIKYRESYHILRVILSDYLEYKKAFSV